MVNKLGPHLRYLHGNYWEDIDKLLNRFVGEEEEGIRPMLWVRILNQLGCDSFVNGGAYSLLTGKFRGELP